MKKLFTILFVLFCLSAYCQSVSPWVTASAGGYFEGTNITQSWTLGETVIETFYGSTIVLTQGFQQPDALRHLMGKLTYNNNASTPLNNCLVRLMQGNTVVQQTTTASNGDYLINNLQNGTYTINATTTKPWGGVNATDALLIMKHFAAISLLTGIRLVAADVDASGYINAVDALQDMKRFVGLQTSFNLGNWVFEHHTVVVDGSGDLIDNFKGICVGDVDGSYNPPNTKPEPTIFLENRGIQLLTTDQVFDVPISSGQLMDHAALSLVLDYPEQRLEIAGAEAAYDNSNLVYHAVNGELRIAWYSLQPRMMQENDRILTLKVRLKQPVNTSASELGFTINPESNLADFGGNVILNKTLTIPVLVDSHEGFSLSQNIPNPFNDFTRISYTIPQAGNVSLVLRDMLGKQLKVLQESYQDAGTYTLGINGRDLDAGVYFYQMFYSNGEQKYLQTRRLVIAR
ncbi:MAG: T9SS type A sorting domain-containing protein [Bacteroidetes bacterium]|nr:T9SS type A sorting domain-containing protein [Bacteroidota bacterium]